MNTNVLSSFIQPSIPDVVKFSSTRQADSVLQKRETLRIQADSVGPFASNATRTILFKLPAGSKFLDLSALRLLFTLQSLSKNNFIQDGCPVIRAVNVYINGLLVESISNYYSLFQNAMTYYTAHDSYFSNQGIKNGFWSNAYGRFPSPSDLFKSDTAQPVPNVSYNGGNGDNAVNGQGCFTETFEIPLSLLGICRSGKLFPSLLCNSIQIAIEIAPKEQVMFQVMATTTPIYNTATPPVITGYTISNKPTTPCPAGGSVGDYQILSGTAMLLCDSVDVTPEYANECYKVAQEGRFSFVIDTFDFASQTCSNSLNNIVFTDAKTKLKDMYCIFKQNNSPQQLTDNYLNPLLRRFQVTIGSTTYPSQAVGGRSSGLDADILANNAESYDQLLLAFNELNNVMAMGIVPWKEKGNGCCSNVAATLNNYQILVGNGQTTHAYNGQKWMLGMNFESNLSSMLSGTDSKSAGGQISILLECESSPSALSQAAGGFQVISNANQATILCLFHYDRQLVFSQGALYLVD